MNTTVEKTRMDLKQLIDELTDDKVELFFAYIKGMSIGIDLTEKKGA